MGQRVKSFGDFILLKESVNDIEAILPDRWKKLQDLGFYDASTLRIKANGNILLKNDKFNYYPEGIVLQPNSGYIRNKGVKSGFIKKDFDLIQMIDYLINRFEKYEGESSSIGISPEVTIFLKNLSKSKATKNQETGRFDFSGSVELFGPQLEKLKKFGIKLGVIEKDFSYSGGKEAGYLTLKDLEFFPSKIKGAFGLRSCTLYGFSDLRSFPTKMGNGFVAINVENLKSLSGSTLNSGRKTDISINACRDLESLGEDLPEEVGEFQLDASSFSEVTPLSSLKGCPKIVHKGFAMKRTKIRNLEGGPEEVRGGKYDVDGNKYLTSLRGFPLEFKGRFSSDELQCWFSLDDRLQIINDGIYYGFQWWNDSRIGPDKASSGQIQFVATSFSPEYIQELIDKNPEKMAVILKGSVKDPLFKGLKWPENLQKEVDLLSDLGDIGL